MSTFSKRYPEYAAIEKHIHRAHAERSVYIAHLLAEGIVTTVRGVKRVMAVMGDNLQAEHERRLIEADSFLRRSVPHR